MLAIESTSHLLRYRRTTAQLAILLLALVGAGGLIVSMHWGVGLSPDSAVYIGSAESLLAGKGLTVPFGADANQPLTHHAPLYPAILAGIGLISGNVQTAALLFNLLLYPLSGLLAYQLGRSIVNSHWAGGIAAGLLLLSPDWWAIYQMAWSETVFLNLCLLAWIGIAHWLQSPDRRWLLLSAGAFGLALLTRYAGVGILAGAILALLLHTPLKMRQRLINLAAFGGLAVLPLALWMLRNLVSAGTANNRSLALHLIERGHLFQLLDTISGWLLLPVTWPAWLRAGIIAALVFFLLYRTLHRSYWPSYLPGIKLLLWTSLGYLAFVVVSLSVLDPNIPLDFRILSPLLPLGTTWIGGAIAAWLGHHPRMAWQRLAILSPILLFGLAAVVITGQRSLEGYNNGLGFNSPVWHTSSMLAAIESLPISTPLYSNIPEAIYLNTGRTAYIIPRQITGDADVLNQEFPSQALQLNRDLVAANARLVIFNRARQLSDLEAATLRDIQDLCIIAQYADGVLVAAEIPQNTCQADF